MYFRANNFYNIYSPSMNHLFKTSLFTFLFFICFLFASHAQYESWFLEGSDSTNGANVQAIYEKNMILHPQNKVIVAEIGRDTSELQSRGHLVCRLLLEKKK